MCGVVGMFERSSGRSVREDEMRRMLALLRHRGPDEFGILLDRGSGLGSARLSIIDPGGGSQPIANEDETLWIVFNGEIFNHIELRQELLARGHRFRTASDTEVILHLFEDLGPACLEKLNGQFAIAIWDTGGRRLFLARDRLGVRPLFYTETADRAFLFASEIKALFSDSRVPRELEPGRLAEVFTFWAAQSPHTVFRGIRELPPGHWMYVDGHSIEISRYWENRIAAPDEGGPERTEEDVMEEFRDLLVDACRIRLRADVPVGAYLSGGLDSSSIAAVVRRHHANRLVTFSIAFTDRQYDESAFQVEMAGHLGTDHHVLRATHEDIGNAFADVVWHAETPLMRTAPAPMFLLSRLVREKGFKVVLTGEGADEFLAGYDIFKEAKLRRFWARQPSSKIRPLLLQKLYQDIGGISRTSTGFLAAFFGNGLNDTGSPWYSHAVRWRNNRRTLRFFNSGYLPDSGDMPSGSLLSALPDGFAGWPHLSQAQHLEVTTLLSQYLLSSQGDRMAMAHSVEGRFPFLDTRLVEFCNSLPPRMKLRGLREKHLLKKAAYPWLPASILQRPKRPYRAPVHRAFFNDATPDYVHDLLSPAEIRSAGIFNPGAVEQLVGKIKDGAALGETDDMALVGILSTQLVQHLFIGHFQAPPPLQENESVRICRIHSKAE